VARYLITYSTLARADLRFEGRRVEALVVEAASRYVSDAPIPVPSQEGQRKALDANLLGAAYRLRVREWRAYYNVHEDAAEVVIVRVGYKPREMVYFQGQPSAMRD